jgi:hypothetical protein
VGTAGKASESRASDIVQRRTSRRTSRVAEDSHQLQVAVSDTKELGLPGGAANSTAA